MENARGPGKFKRALNSNKYHFEVFFFGRDGHLTPISIAEEAQNI
jgi:hypothetical protein